ncbi:MAG: type I methionyl aminopeptidase [Candidatus Absconditabacterales bacterium]|nr:type I methionyl aminopeptidase [Candidatus Absconditabacterales bacterium]
MKTLIKSPQQCEKIRHAGKILTDLHQELFVRCQPGVALIELESFAQRFLTKNNVRGTFKGYKGFPANLCLSLNDCLVHGIPDHTVLKPGDLLKVDVGVTYESCIADAAFSVVIGGAQANPRAASLICATKNALDMALPTLVPGSSLFAYGETVHREMTDAGFSVIFDLTGHGVGNALHEKPYIHNYGHVSLRSFVIKEGMVFALEPITAQRSTAYRDSKPGVYSNGRNLYTEKGDLGCQWEYTVIITQNGAEVVAGLVDERWLVH